jgi:hypothetical protein
MWRVSPARRLVSVAAVRTTPVTIWQSPARTEVRRPDLSALLAPQTHGVLVYDLNGKFVQFPFGKVMWFLLSGMCGLVDTNLPTKPTQAVRLPTPCHNPACSSRLGGGRKNHQSGKHGCKVRISVFLWKIGPSMKRDSQAKMLRHVRSLQTLAAQGNARRTLRRGC